MKLMKGKLKNREYFGGYIAVKFELKFDGNYFEKLRIDRISLIYLEDLFKE